MRNFKNIFSILSLVFAAFILGCGSSGGSSSGTGGGDKKNNTVKITSGSTSTIEEKGGTSYVSFTSDGNWSAIVSSTASSWCSIDKNTGSQGTVTLTVTVKPNDTYDQRNASITITSGNAKATATVTQKQKDAIILSSSKVEVDSKSTSFDIQVQSNVTYTYEIKNGKEWIHEGGGSKALTTRTISFSVDENWEKEVREGEIEIKNGTLSETVKVYQQAGEPKIVISQKEYNVSSAGGDITVELKTNCQYEFKIVPSVDWIEDASTKSVSTYTHKFHIKPNDTYDDRTAEIQYKNLDNDKIETVTVNQAQVNALVLAKNQYEVGYKAETLNFSVNTNVKAFQVSTNVDWIQQINNTKALEEVPLSFSIGTNTSGEAREGLITLTAGEIVQTIKIIQARNQEQMTVSFSHTEKTMNIPTLTGNELSGTIDWGDSDKETYSQSATHNYSDNSEKTVVIDSWNADGIQIDKLKSISSIEIKLEEEKKE